MRRGRFDHNAWKSKIPYWLLIFSIVLMCSSVCILLYNIVTYTVREDNRLVYQEPKFSMGEKKVLFISSYRPTYMTYPAQEKGIDEVFYQNNIAYDSIFMYAKEKGYDEAETELYEKLTEGKITERHYDAILLGDDDALEFAIRYRNSFFENIPLVFMGVNDRERAKTAMALDQVTGCLEEEYIEETIQNAYALLPNAKEVLGIYDSTTTGRGIEKNFYAADPLFPTLQFEGFNSSNCSKDEIIERMSRVTSDTIVVCMVMANDADGDFFTIPDTVDLLTKYCDVPIFTNYSGGVGIGFAGGTHMDMEKSASVAANMIVRILSGEDANSIPLYDEDDRLVVFDANVMDQYHLDQTKLPKETEFLHEEVSFYHAYQAVLLPMMLFIISLIGFTIHGRVRLKESSEQAQIQQNLMKDLKFQNTHDELTHLFNRKAALHFLKRQLESREKFSIIYMDIDNFKYINETYGHEVGDEVLVAMSGSLRKVVEEHNGLIARYSGDEFVVFFREWLPEDGSKIILDIKQLLSVPIQVGLDYIVPSASMGIVNMEGNTTSEDVIARLIMALDEAKASGRSEVVFFHEAMKREFDKQVMYKNRLLDALSNHGLYMLYQPQVDVNTLEVIGYEALVRIKDCELSPAVFIPIAETNGWIATLGRITTELVVKQLSEWQKAGYKCKPVSINFSASQLRDTEYLPFLLNLLKEENVSTNLVEIEITESMIVEQTEYATALFKQFYEAGIQLHMDDFGAGYSSLSSLDTVPVDCIKIDKSLVDTYIWNEKDVFIQDVIQLGHDLGKKIIIEGVEEYQQYEKLKVFGGDIIQGYYFSKPLLPDQTIQFYVNKQEDNTHEV